MPDQTANIQIITLTGWLDETATTLAAALSAGLTAGAVIVADLTAATRCTLDGVAILAAAHKAATTAGAHLRLAAAPPAIRQILDRTGASQVLALYPSVTAALTTPTSAAATSTPAPGQPAHP